MLFVSWMSKQWTQFFGIFHIYSWIVLHPKHVTYYITIVLFVPNGMTHAVVPNQEVLSILMHLYQELSMGIIKELISDKQKLSHNNNARNISEWIPSLILQNFTSLIHTMTCIFTFQFYNGRVQHNMSSSPFFEEMVQITQHIWSPQICQKQISSNDKSAIC
jgi:hypothetical protein